jgi:hypothetical protein
MSIINKIINGGEAHKSRFHDEKSNLLDPGGFIYLPHCLDTTFLRVTVDYRPVLPWLGYRAIKCLDQLLQPDWTMLEWRSGMSTLWFAQRVKSLVSIEDYQPWYNKVKATLNQVKNIDYQFKTENDYFKLDNYPDQNFDFILIDGSERANCVKNAVKKIKRRWYIYLDNSDKHSTPVGGDTRIAEETLLKALRERGGKVKYYVDLVPTYLAVNQGMLIQLN